MRYKLELEYIGQNYKGSQKQPDGIITIQGEIEKALRTLTKKNIKTVFSGRTDAGVSARGQVLHFDFDETLVASKFINSMNGLLPNDISIKNIESVQDDFHAQKSARWRWYRFSITNRTQRSAFDDRTLLVRYQLNLENIKSMLVQLEGEHDFSAFRTIGTDVPSSICKILYTNVTKIGDEILVDIVGTRFLYNMVRTIIGTILMLERNNQDPEKIKEILLTKDRKNAGPTISPSGLTFMKVGYDDWTDETKTIINGDKRI